MTNARARILWTLFAAAFVIVGTALAIRFAQGYRPSRDKLVSSNGLLVANSTPKGARVFVNDRFLTATDDTLYLDPGEYKVEIKKDGYFSWQKTVRVEKELVTQANGLLFPTAPKLSPLTFSGAHNPAPSPDGQRIVFYSASSSAETKNGYYIVDLFDSPLAFQRGSRQITTASKNFPPEKSQLLWSPNSSQLLLISPQKTVLLDPAKLNDVDGLTDISFQVPTTLSQWEEEMYLRDRERLAQFPPLIQQIATESAVNVYFSPDEKKLLYTASRSFDLPTELVPAKPASSTQAQERTTEPGAIYVFDREEDRNFRLGTDAEFLKISQDKKPPKLSEFAKVLLSDDLDSAKPRTLAASPSAFRRLQGDTQASTLLKFRRYHSPLYSHGFQWFPNSAHIVTHDSVGITIREYDNTNAVKVYSGPFNPSFVYPWPNGSRLIMLTNFNQGTSVPDNLYTIDLK